MADRDRDLTDEEVLSELPNDIQQMISDGKLDRDDAIEEWREQAVWDDTAPAGLPTVSPHTLWEQTGGGDAYRVAMLEAGHMYPSAPQFRKDPGSGRALQCGLTHEFNWSPWKRLGVGGYQWEGRWCRTCGTPQSREMVRDG